MEAEKLKPPLNDCGNKKECGLDEKSGLFLFTRKDFVGLTYKSTRNLS